MTGWKMCEHGVLDSKLTVIKQTEDHIGPNGNHFAKWLCECNCNNHTQIEVRGVDLRNGNTKSCVCLIKEQAHTMGLQNSRKNKYDISSYNYGIGWANNSGMPFEFDLSDYELIKDCCWSTCTDKKGYTRVETEIKIGKKYKRISMAQFLTKENDIDHIDKNPLNNKRKNLRTANRAQQIQNRGLNRNNTSGIIGVCFDSRINKWTAYITTNRKRIHLGSFTNKNDAIIARLNGEVKYFDVNFAPQRHLFEKYNINADI
jgi:hypothetical protein